jgi:hypothetical protein
VITQRERCLSLNTSLRVPPKGGEETGKQYIGSSKNLGNRLVEYFRPSYLETQSSRGSVICRALNAYEHDAFSLSILSIGTTLTDQVYSATNLPDFVKLEQAPKASI